MAVEGPQPLKVSLVAAEDLSAAGNQFKAVKLNSTGGAVAITANTDVAVGILQNTPKEGQAAEVTVIGHSKYQGGGVIAVGERLGVQADGQFETVAAANPTRYWFGIAWETTAVAGEIGSGFFNFATPLAALTAN